jgi:glycyl-tRNA synthetase
MDRYDELMSLSVRKGFIWPTADLYGGFAGFYDYGHNGALMKRRLEDLWIDYFLHLGEDYYLIDTTGILPEASLKASGHVEHFTDILVTCTKCGENYRADHLLEEAIRKSYEGVPPQEIDKLLVEHKIGCPKCKAAFGPSKPFHMMFPLMIGPMGKDPAYLRPETAQGVYINFKREFEALRRHLPLGLAIVGRAFRNEISPRQGTYRMREFIQAELQIFFNPKTFDSSVAFDDVQSSELLVARADKKDQGGADRVTCSELVKSGLPMFYVYHLAKVQDFFLKELAVPADRFRFAELGEGERAFYNRIHFDMEVKQDSLGGFKEIGGVHYRGDHDLTGHQNTSKVSQTVTIDGETFIPHVLELSFGIDRMLWALLDAKYEKVKTEKGERYVLHLPPKIAPTQVAVLPLLGKDGLPEKAMPIYEQLAKEFKCFYDVGGSIGRRYARMDEIGTPYCVTIDHQTLQDGTVTIRERDTAAQKRPASSELGPIIGKLLSGDMKFESLP